MPSSKLAKYQAKRDFSRTAEPSGDEGAPASARLRFVIQKHAASRLHYDLRLEVDGVFKSWAVTRGPSLDPADKRLAVEVEDHPIDYGDFEGTIPAGEYGGGTVMLWDRGYWAPEDGFDPAKALDKGELKFVLEGQKLHGGWVLVRLKERERTNRHNWLLIKHRDAAARSHDEEDVLREDRSVASGRAMDQIAAGKGRAPKPFIRQAAGKANAVWRSNRDGGADDKEDDPVGEAASAGRGAEGATGGADAEVRRAAARQPGRAPAAGRRLGARGEVRRLPAADAHRGRRGAASHPQGPRLDGQVPGDRRGGRRSRRRHRRRRGGRARPRRRAGLRGAAGRALVGRHRAAGLLRVRPAVRRRPRPSQAAAERPQGAAEGRCWAP